MELVWEGWHTLKHLPEGLKESRIYVILAKPDEIPIGNSKTKATPKYQVASELDAADMTCEEDWKDYHNQFILVDSIATFVDHCASDINEYFYEKMMAPAQANLIALVFGCPVHFFSFCY